MKTPKQKLAILKKELDKIRMDPTLRRMFKLNLDLAFVYGEGSGLDSIGGIINGSKNKRKNTKG